MSSSYNSPFKEVKKMLPRIYIEVAETRQALKTVRTINIRLLWDESSIKPLIYIVDRLKNVEVSRLIYTTEEMKKLPNVSSLMFDSIGYKRQDDFLGNDGKLLSKSTRFKRHLEYIKCDSNWLKWFLYKVKLLFVRN